MQVVDCYQQENGYDCGICTLLFAEFISTHCESLLRPGSNVLSSVDVGVNLYVHTGKVQGYRRQLLEEITELAR